MSYCDLCKFDDCYFCLICGYTGCECKCSNNKNQEKCTCKCPDHPDRILDKHRAYGGQGFCVQCDSFRLTDEINNCDFCEKASELDDEKFR